MKRPPRSTVAATDLSDSIHHQLNMYALAATAAGVGVLALAQPAEARIVYTPANIPIIQDEGVVGLDLNHDGIDDFQFSNVRIKSVSSLTVFPVQQSNRVRVVQPYGVFYAAALNKGERVGPHKVFQTGQSAMLMAGCISESSGWGCGGEWFNKNHAYLGLEFFIKGEAQFGWARLKVRGELDIKAKLTGYAYETIPNKPIIAGKTHGNDEAQDASLGALAAGAPFRGRRQK